MIFFGKLWDFPKILSVLTFRTFWPFGQFVYKSMYTVGKNVVHNACTEDVHIYTKHKSVTQSSRTVVKTICVQIRIGRKLFHNVASIYVVTKTYMLLYNFVCYTNHTKVKWNDRHQNLQKNETSFYIEKFNEKFDYNCQWKSVSIENDVFYDYDHQIGYNFSAEYDLFFDTFPQNMGRYRM